MRSRLSIGLAAAVLMLSGVASPSCAADEPKVKEERDIVYTKAGGTELKLDLAAPEQGDGPFPAVLVIHGGAWRSGNKADVGRVLPQFAARGYVAVSPQYRFCPKERFPAQVHDVKAAVRWIKAHAKERRIDPEHIGAIGFSAGGHLALMLGVTGPADGLEGDVSAGAPIPASRRSSTTSDPTDLAARDIPEVSKPLVRDFLGATADRPARPGRQGLAAVLRLQGRPADPDVPGDEGPARPAHPGDRAGRRDDRGGRARARRADGRGQPRLGRHRDGAHPQRRRSVLRPIPQAGRRLEAALKVRRELGTAPAVSSGSSDSFNH